MRTLLTLSIVLLGFGVTRAGVVQTVAARLEGKVALDAGQVTVDGKRVNWTDVLYFVPDGVARQPSRSEQVRLRNGEVWSATLVGLAKKTLDVRSDLLGEKKIDLSKVAALDFGARREGPKLETLYRMKGEPVSGALLSIRDGKVLIDSVVGEIELPRETLASYRFAKDGPRVGDGDDWVYLTDGSVLRGQLSVQDQGFQLKHALAGSVALPEAAVCAVVRHPKQLLDLAEVVPASYKMTSILGARGTDSPRVVDGTELSPTRFVKGVQFEPKSTATYVLSGAKGASGKFRATLLPSPGDAGDSRVTIKIGGKTVLEREVTPTSRPDAIALDVHAGDEIELLIDFGARVRYPCGVVLGDPHVAWN